MTRVFDNCQSKAASILAKEGTGALRLPGCSLTLIVKSINYK